MGNAIAQCTPAARPRGDAEAALAAAGYPTAVRIQRWMMVSGASVLKQRTTRSYLYWQQQVLGVRDAQQIEKDVPRANRHLGPTRQSALRRILRAHACRRDDIGYTQGFNIVVAAMLMVEREWSAATEEACFWLLCAITDQLLPDYFTSSLLGVRTDAVVLEGALRGHPELADLLPHLEAAQVDLTILTTPWLMVVFANTLPTSQLLRVWDLFFAAGARALIATSIAIFALRAPLLRHCTSFEEAWPLLSELQHGGSAHSSTRAKGQLGTVAGAGAGTLPLVSGGEGAGGSTEGTLPTETLMAIALQELRRLPSERMEELRVQARQTDGMSTASTGTRASPRLRLRQWDRGAIRPAEMTKVLAAVGLAPSLPERWVEATFLRTAVGLHGAHLGPLHALRDDASAAPAIGAYVRSLDWHALDNLDEAARRQLLKVRFRLRALETPAAQTARR